MIMDTVQRGSAPARPLSALSGPRALPILGNLLQIDLQRMHLRLEEWARRYGDLFTWRLGPRPILVVSDTALIQKILKDRPNSFRRMSAVQDVMREIGIDGVFTAEGEAWSRQRRLIMSAFNSGHVRKCYDEVARITGRLERRLSSAAESGAPLDALRELMRYTVDVTSAVAFGIDMNTIEQGSNPLQRHLENIFSALHRRINAPFPYWRYIKLPADRALDRVLAEVEGTIVELIQKARADVERDPARAASPRNLLESMVAARDLDASEARLSVREVYGNVLTLLLAGEDTTANTIAWMLYFMAKYPAVQARMQAEADALLGPSGISTSIELCQKLRTVAAVAQETLRLKPAAPMLFLEPLQDTVLGDVTVPAGTWVIVLTRLIALKEENFHAPADFDASRWIESPAGGRHEPRAALSFGAGPRVCPGRSLALLECSMVGAMVARRFQVSLVQGGAAVRERLDFTMAPEGLSVRLSPRPG